MRLRRTLAALLGLALSAGAGGVPAQRLEAPAPLAKTAPTGPPMVVYSLTRDDVETWLDGFVPYALKSGDVAGAVVVVVKGGQVLLEKGYGYADVKAGTPVSPTQTLFRPGSVSKLFTWTAVMQLVEQRRIDLDADINTYLDFKIPPRDGKPITMRELMQHTAGFGEIAKHLILEDPRRLMSLESYLKAWTPPRIFAAGEVPAYSNYGAALAGYIVQRVSGEPFADYIEAHILRPLGMAHSTFRQPLPASLAPLMSKGYIRASGEPGKFELLDATPAGVMTTSGDDMGRFMLAHLGHGSLGGVQILKPETAAEMHRQSFQATPPLPGFALGFYHEDRNGHEVIGHAGDTNQFHSDLHLLLNDGVGLYISENSLGAGGAAQTIRSELYREFMDRYFPAATSPPEPTLVSAKHDGAMLVGSWRFTRRSQGDVLDFVYLLGQMDITMSPGGIVTISGIKSSAGVPIKWRETAPFVWREVGGTSRMAAVVKGGKVVAIGMDNEPPVFVLQRTPVAAQANLVLPILGAAVAVLVLTVILWPVTAIVRRRHGRAFAYTGARGWSYRLTRLVALSDLVFIVGMLTALVVMASGHVIDGDQDGLLRLFQVFGVIGLAGVLIGPWNVVQAWRTMGSSWWAKLTSLAVALALIVVSYLGFSLHLFAPSLNY